MVADVTRLGGIVLLALATAAGAAGSEADPTLPPGVADSQHAEGQAGGKPVLESVLIPAKGRPLAVISGKPVKLGEKVGEFKLVKVTENEVVLRGPSEVIRLFLNPAVSLKSIARPPADKHEQSRGRSQP